MKVPDLVEEDGAAVGGLELADLELVGTREGASLVTEQLALQELSRHGGAVDLDEWPSPAGGEVVDRPGDQLLAGAGLTSDENGDVDAGRFTEDLTRFQHLGAAPELQLPSESASRASSADETAMHWYPRTRRKPRSPSCVAASTSTTSALRSVISLRCEENRKWRTRCSFGARVRSMALIFHRNSDAVPCNEVHIALGLRWVVRDLL